MTPAPLGHEEAGFLLGGPPRATEVALYRMAIAGTVLISREGEIALAARSRVDGPVQAAVATVVDMHVEGRADAATLFTMVAQQEVALQPVEARLFDDGLRRPWSGKPTRLGRRLLDAYRNAYHDDPVAAVVFDGWEAVPQDWLRDAILVRRQQDATRARLVQERIGAATQISGVATSDSAALWAGATGNDSYHGGGGGHHGLGGHHHGL
jgi:hypothetical protein